MGGNFLSFAEVAYSTVPELCKNFDKNWEYREKSESLRHEVLSEL